MAFVWALVAIAVVGLVVAAFFLGRTQGQKSSREAVSGLEKSLAELKYERALAREKITAAKVKAIQAMVDAGKSGRPSMDDALRLLREAQDACSADGICQ